MGLDDGFTPEERVESVKAAVLAGAATAGVTALLLLTHRSQALGWAHVLSTTTAGLAGLSFWIGVGIGAISGSLFGITYRYAIRQDRNPQLKSGVVLAFGLVRGLALIDTGSALAQQGQPWLTALAESLLLFGTAAALLEVALQNRWIKPFGAD